MNQTHLIAGLGNIGETYDFTRHNIGFEVLNKFIKKYKKDFIHKKKGYICRIETKGNQIMLLKPNTFMNLSGNAVRYWLQKNKLSPNHLIIVLDDIHFPFGKLKLKPSGSSGGHNGLKNIEQVLQTRNYPRLRFGVGSEFSKVNQSKYVLGKWSKEEREKLPILIDKAVEMLESMVFLGIEKTMNQFN